MSTFYETLKNTPYGSYGKYIGHTLHGINHDNRRPILRNVPEGEALVFFTRPYFNMQASNLRNDPIMTNIITEDIEDVQTFLRMTLDPDLATNEYSNISCSMLDNSSPFIPVLTNTLLNMSGWPDRIMPTFTSSSGMRGEQYSMPDGVIEINSKQELTLTFENMDGSINEKLLEYWMYMMSLQNDGVVVPYSFHEAYKEKNYDARIYVLIMDYTNRLVVDCATVVSCYPINDNKGAKFNINQRKREKTTDFSLRFECNIIRYSDPRILYEFNLVQGKFNSEVFKLLTGKPHSLIKIPPEEKYDHKSLIPIIDFTTMELCWYKNSK